VSSLDESISISSPPHEARWKAIFGKDAYFRENPEKLRKFLKEKGTECFTACWSTVHVLLLK